MTLWCRPRSGRLATLIDDCFDWAATAHYRYNNNNNNNDTNDNTEIRDR
jgi:hypothetical protein